MADERTGQTAVIFVSRRNDADPEGYAEAAAAMDALVAGQPGYCGVDSTRGADGLGITVSYWADDAAAVAWRNHPAHAATCEQARAGWYESYSTAVGTITRSYAWTHR